MENTYANPYEQRILQLEDDLKTVCSTFKTISDMLNLSGTEGDNSMVFMKVAEIIPKLTSNPEAFGFNNPKLMEIVNRYGNGQTAN